MSRPGALLFDLDGTLVDTGRDLAAALDRVRVERGLAPLGAERITPMVGRGARNLVREGLGGEPGGDDLDRALGRFLELYAEGCVETSRPYPGVPAMLRRLETVFPLALLTNKPEAMTVRILEHLELARFFRRVVAGDTMPVRKPDPGTVLHLAAALGRPVPSLMLVGDGPVDAETAARAGCRLALVDWGFSTAAELLPFEAEVRAAEPAALARALLAL